MTNDRAWLGRASLWASIVGIILPGCLFIVVLAVGHLDLGSMVLVVGGFSCSGLVFAILELLAFGCGIAARRTATGMAGLVISGVFLGLAAIAILSGYATG